MTSRALSVLANAFRVRASLFMWVLVSAPAWSATWMVTTTGEPGALDTNNCAAGSCATLREAINASASGDTIRFAPALDGQAITLALYTNCLSAGAAASPTCKLPAAGQFGPSAFFISGARTLTIDAVTGLTRGITIARSSVAGTAAFRLFDVEAGSTLNLSGLTLSNGLARGGDSAGGGGALGAGGAIFNRGQLFLNRCTLAGNRAQGGGQGGTGSGGGGVGQTSPSRDGGGPNGGSGETAGIFPVAATPGGFGGGGGANNAWGAGAPGGFGGGGGRAGSLAIGGAGGFGAGGGRGDLSPGGAAGFGGRNGTSTGSGGGAGMGGAIFNHTGNVSLANSTLSGNTATGGVGAAGSGSGLGGAIFNYDGALSLDFATLAANGVAAGSPNGGAIYSYGIGAAVVTMSNSIAANNSGGASDVLLLSSSLTGARNAIGALSGTTSSLTLPVAATPLNLGALVAGGGLESVMVPQAGSTAINAGFCGAVTIDQRGIARPRGAACDIGAVEAPIAPTISKAFAPAAVQLNGTSDLTVTVSNPDVTTLTNAQFSDSMPAGVALVSQVGGSCGTLATGGGSFSIDLGVNSFTSTSNSLAPGQSCTIIMQVRGTAVGAHVNTTSQLTATGVPPGGPATAALTVAPGPQSLTFPAQSPASRTFIPGATFAINPLATSATPNSGSAIVYSSLTAGVCTVTGTTVTMIAAGTCTIAANQAGDASYTAAAQVMQGVTIGVAAQTLTFAAQSPTTRTFTAGATFAINPFATSATPNSGSAIVYSSLTAGVCTVTGTTVTMIAAGTCTIAANQAGDANYAAAMQVAQNVAIGVAPQTLAFPAQSPASRTFTAGATFAITPRATSATPNSGSAIVYSSLTVGVCTVAGTTVTMVAAGTCTIAANQAGDANYAAATQVTQAVAIGVASQALTFPAQSPASRTFTAGGTFAINPLATSATPNSGSAIVFSSLTSSVCTVTGTTVTMVAAGTCTIAANQAGDANYAAATQVTQAVAIGVAPQTLSFPAQSPASRTFTAGATFAINPLASSATPNSGSAILYSSLTAGVCTVTGTTVTMLAAGTCTIAANQAGDANHAAAPQVTQGVAIATAVVTSYTGPSATGTGIITASFTGGGLACSYATSQFIPLAGHPRSPPAGTPPVAFPHGLFDFTTTGCTPGATITMTITYPAALPPATQYWKYGPTPSNATQHWYVLAATIAGNTAIFSITDGGIGDDDLTPNGTIVDQGGPGAPIVGAAVPVPTLSDWAMLILASLLLVTGVRRHYFAKRAE